ncbi:hypothetical protein FACS1894159_10990 [Bacteroidia bacterium]|nr:hypothetical protein FACS1894159_10990 [Bacteroidia bacterium]
MRILSLNYLGNIEWFCNLCFEHCIVDIHEHYRKQSYRNRALIMTSEGVQALSVQVVRPDNRLKPAMCEVRIDYSKRWQHQHWNAICSAYRSSPYFDHYAPLFEPLYLKRFDFLADLNTALLEAILGALNVEPGPNFSTRYIEPGEGVDLRETISPKAHLARPDPRFTPQPYYQLFGERHPFAANLSMLDLLMCEGPRTMEILRASWPSHATNG